MGFFAKISVGARLYLYKPSCRELDYRRKLLSQPDTMSFNKGYHLDLDNYDNETGCINFVEKYWSDWYARWNNRDTKNYYAYIMEKESKRSIGEVALRYEKEKNAYCVNIIIEAEFRGRGYSEEAIRLLVDTAFNQLGADKLYDDFPDTRISAERVFKKIGFIRISNSILELTKSNYLKSLNN